MTIGSSSEAPLTCTPLTVQEQLCYVLCVACKRIFKNSITLSRHLEQVHKEPKKDSRRRAVLMVELASKAATSEVQDARGKYETTPLDEVEKACVPLPMIDGIEVMRAIKCTDCEQYFLTRRGMQLHLQGAHEKEPRIASEKAVLSSERGFFAVQSLQGGSKSRFFRVYKEGKEENDDLDYVGESPERQPNEITLALISKAFPKAVGPEILDYFADVVDSEEDIIEFHEQAEEGELQTYNEFIAALRVSDILKQEKVDVETGAALIGQIGESTDTEKDISYISRNYLEQVAECAAVAALALLDELFPRDDKLFEPVSAKSAVRYSNHLANFLCFAYRVFRSPKQESRVSQRLNDLFSIYEKQCAAQAAEKEKLFIIHKVMKLLCFVRRNKSAGVKGLFVRLYFACKCVVSECWRGKRKHQFMEASEISPCLAAMQYYILATALYELSGVHVSAPEKFYNEESNQDNLSVEIWEV